MIEGIHAAEGVQTSACFGIFNNKKQTAGYADLNRVIPRYFQSDAFLFGSNYVRKVWDSFQERNKSVLEGLQSVNNCQTAHGAETRQEHYNTPATDQDVLRLFQLQSKALAAYFGKNKENAVSEHAGNEQNEIAQYPAGEAGPSKGVAEKLNPMKTIMRTNKKETTRKTIP